MAAGKHTSTPWKWVRQGTTIGLVTVEGENEVAVAWRRDDGHPGIDVGRADRDFIVRACNQHDELVGLLRRILDMIAAYNRSEFGARELREGHDEYREEYERLAGKTNGPAPDSTS